MKFEPGTEQFHAKMHAHWSRALEAHKQEIAEQGMNLARKLTLVRLEVLVRGDVSDTDKPTREAGAERKPQRRSREEDQELWAAYWAAVDAIPAEDLESWVEVPLPPPREPIEDDAKKLHLPDVPLIGSHCPDCGFRWFRCSCANKTNTKGADVVGRKKRTFQIKPEIVAACGLYSCGACYVVGLDEDSDPDLVHPPRPGFDLAYLLGLDRAAGLVPPAPPKPKAAGRRCWHCNDTRQCACVACTDVAHGQSPAPCVACNKQPKP